MTVVKVPSPAGEAIRPAPDALSRKTAGSAGKRGESRTLPPGYVASQTRCQEAPASSVRKTAGQTAPLVQPAVMSPTTKAVPSWLKPGEAVNARGVASSG